MNLYKLICFSVTAFGLIVSNIYGDEVLVRMPSGENLSLEVDSSELFVDVMKRIEAQIQSENVESNTSFVIDFHTLATVQPGSRNYNAAVSASEKDDLRYIVTTLATASWPSLLAKKSSLKKAGDRIDHLHPLRFLRTVFNDEELNGCLHVIRDRSKVWKEFYSGLSDTLEKEASANNITDTMVADFAKSVKVNVKLISKPIKDHNWDGFIEILMEQIPRGGDPDRYDN